MENFDEKLLVVSETPHLRSYKKTSGIMGNVFLALCPAALWGVYVFGLRALIMILVCVSASVLSETAFNLVMHKENTVHDMSAAVTGLLIAMNVSSLMPFWQAALGCVFAIVVVKMMFGGLGCNFMNPALSARAFLMASFASNMTRWASPFDRTFKLADAVTGATPLSDLSNAKYSLLDMFLGKTGGCIGEVSALLLIIGGLYLMVRKIIRPRIPVSYILTVAVLTCLVSGFDGVFTLKSLLSGGLMLGAFFMATDYVTTPVTGKGMIAAGVLCGILTVSIRTWGGYPEGVSYSILLMNAATPLIDRVCKNKRFGEASKWQRTKRA